MFLDKANFLRDLIAYTVCDMAMHPFFLIESRYVLQNRLPHFQVYSNIWKFKSRSEHEVMNGFMGHFPKNFLYLAGLHLFYDSTQTGKIFLSTIIGHTFMYPVLTGMRRIACQSSTIPGMLPLRYFED